VRSATASPLRFTQQSTMAWRWRSPWTPKTSGAHGRPHRRPASTRLTIALVIAVLVAVVALAAWYSQ